MKDTVSLSNMAPLLFSLDHQRHTAGQMHTLKLICLSFIFIICKQPITTHKILSITCNKLGNCRHNNVLSKEGDKACLVECSPHLPEPRAPLWELMLVIPVCLGSGGQRIRIQGHSWLPRIFKEASLKQRH